MMEIFGLIHRNRLPLGVPYMPSYSPLLTPGLGGLGGYPGMSPMSGLGGFPGMSPMSGLGGVPGMSPMYGLGGVPGMGTMPGAGGWPGGGFPGAGGIPGNWVDSGRYGYGSGQGNQAAAGLDGIWELENGGFVIIQGSVARLYISRERYQDFAVRYDRQYLWWRPREGGAPSRYLYQTREGRMILRDEEGNMLLLRRRR